MRIVHVGHWDRPWETEQDWQAAFEALGHDVIPIETRRAGYGDIRAQALAADLLLWSGGCEPTQPLDETIFTTWLLADRGIPSATLHLDPWWGLSRGDCAWWLNPMFQAGTIFTASGDDQGRWDRWGRRHVWLPPAVRHTVPDQPGTPRPEWRCDVALVGSNGRGYHPEWPYRRQLYQQLTAMCARNRWRFLNPGGDEPRISREHMTDFYASATVTVGDSLCPQREKSLYWCVDELTEMLTSNGWKSYDQINPTVDLAYTINPETQLGEWQPIQALSVFPGEPRRMLALETARHSSLTTLDHRWLVRSQGNSWTDTPTATVCPECNWTPPSGTARAVSTHRRKAHGVVSTRRSVPAWTFKFKHSKDLRVNDSIPLTAPCIQIPTVAKHSDAMVEIMAWLWTEGSYSYSQDRYKGITQSHAVNAPYVARIRAALTAEFGPPVQGSLLTARPHKYEPSWTERIDPSSPKVTFFAFNKPLGELLAGYAPRHVVDYGFIHALTAAQLRLYIDTSIDADGCRKTSGGSTCTTLAQKEPERLGPFEMACVLLGLATSRTPHDGCWILTVKTRAYTAPTRNDPGCRKEVVKHDGIVWCPTTDNGTWLARRRGTTYFTGNSDRFPEATGRRGLVIAPRIDALAKLYPAMPTYPWGNWAALEATIAHLLDSPDERAWSTAECHAVTAAGHTYLHRARTVLDTLGLPT